MNEDAAKNIVLNSKESDVTSDRLKVGQLDEEPDFWLVSVLSENGEPMIGGTVYVVNSQGGVFESSGSYPPRRSIELAKEHFEQA